MTEPTAAEDVHALLGAYVLDALDDDERVAFERHLAACGDCSSEVPGMQAAAARMGATAYVSAPAPLRSSVMSEVSRTRQLPPVVGVASLEQARRRRLGTRLLSAAAALLLVVAGGLGIALGLEQRQADQEQENIIALLTDPENRAVVDVPGGGTVVLNTSGDRALVEMRGVPAPPTGKAYELWVVPDSGNPIKAGLMPTGEGRAYIEDLSEAAALAVTQEPAAGSEQPTTEPLLSVEV